MSKVSRKCILVVLFAVLALSACGGDDPVEPDVTDPVGAQLAVRVIANGTVRATMASVEVEIRDASGALVADATDLVTIAIGANPGNLLLHTSGISDGDRFIELVDHATPVVLTPELSINETVDEMLGLAYDDASGVMYATNREDTLYSIDITTGVATAIGAPMVAPTVKGIAYSSAGNVLLGVQRDSDIMLSIDPATGDTTALGQVTIAGDVLEGFTGLDFDPTTGTLYAVAKLQSRINNKDRELVTIDPSTLVATSVASLSEDGIAAITFLTDGSLLAVTGDGATNPETLWSVDMGTGVLSLILMLGNGDDGESIEAIPARLSGTLSVAAVNGVATFNNLVIDGSGVGYTLVVSAAGLTGGTSAAFNINQ